MGMNLLAFFFFGALIIYLVIIVVLSTKWKKGSLSQQKGKNTFDYPVSLLVPFRNELENLPRLLANLESLTYQSLQVILIDDHSQDRGAEYVQEWIAAKGMPSFMLVKSQEEGKKAAIEQGVVVSNGFIILTTDADCLLPEDWVQNMLQPFNDSKVQMVAGPVISKGGKTKFDHFQQIDWAGILLVTNFFFQIKKPVMCSAANMGYRKEAFYHLRGYQGNSNQLSGDDSFLLEKMSSKFGSEAIAYQPENEVLVKTAPAKTWRQFLSQRSRWARKWNKHQFWENAFGAIISALLSTVSLLSFLLLFGGGIFPVLFVFYWGIKMLFEYLILKKVLDEYKIKLPVLSFAYASFFHPIYVVLVAISSFWGKSTWKGRKGLSKVHHLNK